METHDELKVVAKDYLRSLGFLPEEIHEEYKLSGVDSNGLRMIKELRVDIAGIKKDMTLSIAIECGSCQAEKITQLNLFFDEVILLPYMNDRLSQSSRIKSLEDKLKFERQHRESLINTRISLEKNLFGRAIIRLLDTVGCIPVRDGAGLRDIINRWEDDEYERQHAKAEETSYIEDGLKK